MISFRTAIVLPMTAVMITACTGSDKPPVTTAADSSVMASQAAAWKAGRDRADSLTKSAPGMSAVVKKLGAKRYDEADETLKAAVLKESAKTRDCYTRNAKELDPTLAIVTYMLVNYGLAGWDLVRVEQYESPSPAAAAVVTCINSRAKAEWKLPMKGVKPGAHLVRIDYLPDSSRKE